MPEGADGGAGEELHYVEVEQDLDQSPEGPKASFADEGKPRSIFLVFFKLSQYSMFCLCIYVQELI